MATTSIPWFLDPVQVAADKKHQSDVAAQSLAERQQADAVAANKADLALKTRQQAFAESQAAAKAAALAGIASQLQQSTGYSPAPGAPAPAPGADGAATGTAPAGGGASPDELAGENAGYARAKDRTGLSLQSAMKGLRGAMASRGISGSGIEATETAKLYGGGVGELADTDRQMAETGATRAFTRSENARDRSERGRQFDSDAQARRLSQLISVYGSMY